MVLLEDEFLGLLPMRMLPYGHIHMNNRLKVPDLGIGLFKAV